MGLYGLLQKNTGSRVLQKRCIVCDNKHKFFSDERTRSSPVRFKSKFLLTSELNVESAINFSRRLFFSYSAFAYQIAENICLIYRMALGNEIKDHLWLRYADRGGDTVHFR